MPSNREPRASRAEPDNGHPPARRAAPPSGWGGLDSEYRAGGEDSPQDKTLPQSGFSWRFVKTGEAPADPRVRYAFAILVLWLMVSGFFQGFGQWLALGFALAIYAVATRAAFRRYGLAGRGWVLAAMGVGQMLVSFSFAFSLGILWVPIGLYWAGVLIAWALVELRGMTSIWR